MARTPRFTSEQVENALRLSAGIASAAADRLKCAPNTVSNYIKRSKKLQEVQRQIVEQNLDLCEATLLTSIKEKNLTAVIFYLKCKGKHRGYIDRVESSGPDGGPIQVASVGVLLPPEQPE